MIYADTSALVKLIVVEAESGALSAWLATQSAPVVSSSLCRVEVAQTCRRLTHRANDEDTAATLSTAEQVLHAVDMLPLSEDVVDLAASLSLPGLRSLDALHLATALTFRRDLSAFLVYDRRLLTAAQSLGLPIVSAGAP